MENTAQLLQDALLDIPVRIGREYLLEEITLPSVVLIPTSDTLTSATTKGALARAITNVDYICRAKRYDEAQQLALLVLAFLVTLGAKPEQAVIQYGSEVWNNYTIRAATLRVPLAMTVEPTDVTRVRVEQFIQHVKILPLTTLIPQEAQHGAEPEGHTLFEQST